jgi:hypothetical protein
VVVRRGGRGEGAQVAAEAVEVAPPEAAAVLVFVAVVDEVDYVVEVLELLGRVWRFVSCHCAFDYDRVWTVAGFEAGIVMLPPIAWSFQRNFQNSTIPHFMIRLDIALLDSTKIANSRGLNEAARKLELWTLCWQRLRFTA